MHSEKEMMRNSDVNQCKRPPANYLKEMEEFISDRNLQGYKDIVTVRMTLGKGLSYITLVSYPFTLNPFGSSKSQLLIHG